MSLQGINPNSIPFRAAEGQQQRSSGGGAIVPALLLGGAAAGGTYLWGGKKMDVDTFNKTLAEGKDVEFTKELDEAAKAKYEAAKAAAKADAPATTETPKAGEAPKAETPAPAATETPVAKTPEQLTAEHNINVAETKHAQALEVVEKQKGLTNSIIERNGSLATFDMHDNRPSLNKKELETLQRKQKSLTSAINNNEALLKSKLSMTAEQRNSLKAAVDRDKAELDGINKQLHSPEELRKQHIESMQKQVAEDIKRNNEEAAKAQSILDSTKSKIKKAEGQLAEAQRVKKSPEAIATIQERINGLKLQELQAQHKVDVIKIEKSFNSSLSEALGKTKLVKGTPVIDLANVQASTQKLVDEQKGKCDPQANKGTAYDALSKTETEARTAAKELVEANKGAGNAAEIDAITNKILGKDAKAVAPAVADAGKAAAKEGGEASKPISAVVKEGFEATKDFLKKVKPGAGKIALFGGITAAVVYIAAKMAGGSKTEQA